MSTHAHMYAAHMNMYMYMWDAQTCMHECT